jgi:hypothetical protein
MPWAMGYEGVWATRIQVREIDPGPGRASESAQADETARSRGHASAGEMTCF